MKNLRFYENDADFKAKEINAGGDGNSIETSIPGVASIWEENKTYYNPHDEEKLTHTLTVNYKNKYGDTIAESDTIEVKYYGGVEQEIVVLSKNIDNYKQREHSKTVTIPENNSVTFVYDTLDYSSVPLTFNIISSGTIYWKASNTSYTKMIQYKKNDGNWTNITSTTGNLAPSISVSAGDVVQFRGDNVAYGNSSYYYSSFSGSTARFEVEGNIMSLIDSTNFATATTLASFTFYYLFYNCIGLTSAKNLVLPATTLARNCYDDMFRDCTSLTTAPSLPATTLASYCYYSMFYGCKKLTAAPELPATTLANQCYREMFYCCTSLATAPLLPATTLATWCYIYMFVGCTSLTTAPELPATTLVRNCYEGMFSGCTSLIQAPSLPATTLADGCYLSMFQGCTSLTTTPELPATTLASACYENMFYGCTSLTQAPELPATTLEGTCYYGMFNGCTSLTTAPELPATTLTYGCYNGMFSGCTSLTTAPELPATTLADCCYMYMFIGCTSLNYIKCLATNISAYICTYYWVYNVASSGTFVKNQNMSGWTTDASGIPTNWTVQDA